MLHLKTFGGLSVAVDGAPVGGAAQQRKTLALLALLAAGGRHGISRDKLIAYLWPDADAEHARGLLKQACYALRRDLHQPDLLLGAAELRLNLTVIASDVQAFQVALERRDPAQAAALYAGPFLDGFYLNDSPAFERWVEAERERLHRRACSALETLATSAVARGDDGGAVESWRRLAGLEPLNSRVALGLMNALGATGDRAGALQVARVHESLLRDELDTAPDAAVMELTERLRAESESLALPRYRAVPAPTPSMEAAKGEEGAAAADATRPDRNRGAAARGSPNIRKRVAVGFALIVASLLIGGWLVFRTPFGVRSAETVPEPKRLVVLPFANLGPPDAVYFADGIAEEITARLAAIRGLRVIGSTSAQVYRGKAIAEIGRELAVDYVLEGSVRWQKPTESAARVRVTTQLVSTKDGTHLWAEVYDEPLDEIFRVQADIAQKVVRALDLTLGNAQRRVVEAVPTRNLEAYSYYLRGIDYRRRGTESRFARSAVRLFERAVELDSTFAAAWGMLALAHNQMYWMHYDHSEERRALVKRAVDRAFALDPELPEAHIALGAYYTAVTDYERGLREYDLAASARPGHYLAYSARAVLRVREGKFREALMDLERARQLDPAYPLVWMNSGVTYDLLRDFPRAEVLYDSAIALAPDRSNPYWSKTLLYLRWDGHTQRARGVLEEETRAAGVAGDPLLLFTRVLVEIFDHKYDAAMHLLNSEMPEVIADQNRFIPRAQLYAEIHGLMRHPDLARAYYDSARAFIVQRVQEQPDDSRLRSALGIAYAGLGRKEEAIREGQKGAELLPISQEAMRGYYREWDLARIYVMVGEHDAALDRLEYLLSIPGPLTGAWLRIDPDWDPLRGDPRFQTIVNSGK